MNKVVILIGLELFTFMAVGHLPWRSNEIHNNKKFLSKTCKYEIIMFLREFIMKNKDTDRTISYDSSHSNPLPITTIYLNHRWLI